MPISEDQKTHWNLLEAVRWISTRNEERVSAMWDMDEYRGIAAALFGEKPEFDPRCLLFFKDINPDAVETPRKSTSRTAAPLVGPSEALDALLKKAQSGRIRMTAIRCDGSCNEQIEVPLAELNDLVFRLCPGEGPVSVGLWSRSRRVLVWRSPQFLRVEVIRIWPARNTKTAAVSGAVLQHLRRISIPEAPLTKREAQQRCMTEVPSAYAGAFKKAWGQLESSHKRGAGKHGPRTR
jgi:hypothetical protein